MKISKSIALLALSGFAVSALAAEAPMTPPAAFVEQAAQGGMSEIALGKAALKKSQNPDVQAFARRMINDHGKANAELAGIAKSRNLMVPMEMDAKHMEMVEMVANKDGAEFDQAYGAHMNMDHSKAIALFEGASKSSDRDLAGFAMKTLPTLKEHKVMAQKLPGAAAR